MSIHDDYIKRANKEIDKLTADIEKKKNRIASLKTIIKIHENEKARDMEFSESLLKLLNENGVTSDEDRKEMISKIEEIILTREIENNESLSEHKAENEEETETASTDKSEKSSTTVNAAEVKNEENDKRSESDFYQNPYQSKI